MKWNVLHLYTVAWLDDGKTWDIIHMDVCTIENCAPAHLYLFNRVYKIDRSDGHTGTRSFFTSSTARWSFIFPRFSVSSTVISTWSSSFRCSQFGLPRFCSSCNKMLNQNIHCHKSVSAYVRIQGKKWCWCFAKK